MASLPSVPIMTDQNVNKIDLQAQVEPIPDDDEVPPTDAPLVGPIPVGDGIPPLSDSANRVAASGAMPITNPFEDVAEPAPLEADFCDLAAGNPGVQLTEVHRVHLGNPTPMPSTIQSGTQEREDKLAHIGMAVRVTCKGKATGVPVTGAPATSMGHPPTQTVTTHQEIRGVVVVSWMVFCRANNLASQREMICTR